jgi:hypothetical protein
VDHAEKSTYLWWHEDHWNACRSYFDDERLRKHLAGKEIYGIYGSEYTCFSAIDADYHGGDYAIFYDQIVAVLKKIHGVDGWHYSFGPRGIHLIRVHPRIATTDARADLRQLLQQIDAEHPDLRMRAIEANMKPISDWEIYPDTKQGFRLPLARGRTVLLDKPCNDLTNYIEWQIEPHYCSLDDALAEIFKVILPAPAISKDQNKDTKKKKSVSEVGRVFGSLRGRYAKVLVDFWSGSNNPPDSLNCAIMLTTRMMPFYFAQQHDAVDFIETLIDDLPDHSFSDRLLAGKRKSVSRIVRQSVKAVYGGNAHQSDPQLSTGKLNKTFQAWKNKGFSLIDRSTWGHTSGVLADDFSFSTTELEGIAYFADILKSDLQTTADATRHLLRLLAGHSTGQMSVRYVKNLLAGFGICCGHHGKVNEYLNALCQAGWIAQVAGYVPGRRGKIWQVGQRMLEKFSSSTITKPSPASIICVPFRSQQGAFPLVSDNKPLSTSIFVSHLPFNKQSLWQRKEDKLNQIMRKSCMPSSDSVPTN